MPSSVQETRGQTIGRRVRTIPLVLVAFVLVTGLLPVLFVVALLVDLYRRVASGVSFVGLRLVAMLWCFLVADVLGLAFSGLLWVASGFGRRRAWLTARTWGLQRVWSRWLFGAVRTLFGMSLIVEGDDAVSPGPVLVLIRHASIVDNLLPANLVTAPHGLSLRYILKRELLMEPCLDVAGKRLPNRFIRRDSGDPAEIEGVVALAQDLGPADGVLIYPEGTRFTPERRDRGLARIAERDPARAARLAGLQYLLAPRTGGVTGLLEGAPDVDVLLCAHHGFDGLRLVSDIWAGGLVGRRISVRFARVPRAEIPTDRDGQVRWLDDAWLAMDGWIAERDGADRARLSARREAA
jgi:1-acyl-sn-glycerol-3-phosphate acyltransferase